MPVKLTAGRAAALLTAIDALKSSMNCFHLARAGMHISKFPIIRHNGFRGSRFSQQPL